MDGELVEAIEGLVYARWKAVRRMATMTTDMDAIQRKIMRIDRQLSFLRSKCLLYKEYSSIQNLALLGEEFVRRAKRDLPPLTFATSIMCKRIAISADGFYGGLREDVNLYTAPNESILCLDALNQAVSRMIVGRIRISILPSAYPASDANSLINWLVVGQVGKDGKLRILKSFFVKYERKIPELLDDFNDYYRYHRHRQVIFYYDVDVCR